MKQILRREILKQHSDSLNKCVSANHIPILEKELLVKQLEAQNLKVEIFNTFMFMICSKM